MKHAVIVGHPDPDSFTLALANRYVAAVRDRGHDAVLRDLYRMDFDPRLWNGTHPDVQRLELLARVTEGGPSAPRWPPPW